MLRKEIAITIALFSCILLLTACMEENTNDTDSSDTTQSSNETDPSKAEETIKAPESGLQKKDTGDKVQALQNALNHIGYTVKTNGTYDESTTWAITDLQLQQGIQATGVYHEETKNILEGILAAKETIKPGAALPQETEASTTDNGVSILFNPYDQLALVNKESALPADYIPEDLVVPDVPFPFDEDLPKKKMRMVAAEAMEKLFQATDEAGLDLYAQSGYRSYETQVMLFNNYAEKNGKEAANRFSAHPGESEHQSGLTMDVTSPEVNFKLVEEFGQTDEGKWLVEHAAEYGFIIRYPKGKEEITEYQYEPWHLRYVGKKAAKVIMSEELTLEEYLAAE